LVEAEDRHTVYGEHESFQGRIDASHVTGGIDNAWLQSRSMSNFQQRIDVLQVYLPELEDLALAWMQSREVDIRVARTE
jgi:hypothetical protein